MQKCGWKKSINQTHQNVPTFPDCIIFVKRKRKKNGEKDQSIK